MWLPQYKFDLLIYGRKSLDVTWGAYWTLWAMILYHTKCTISKLWNILTVLKLLRALSKSSKRSSDHLNLEFESVPAATACSLVLLANLFLIKLFSIRISLLCLSICAYASPSIDRAEWLHETSWLAFQNRVSTAKRASSLAAHLL